MKPREIAIEALLEGSLSKAQSELLIQESAKDADFSREYASAVQAISFEHALRMEMPVPGVDFTDDVMTALLAEAPQEPMVEAAEKWWHPPQSAASSVVDWLCDHCTPVAMQWAVAASVLCLTSSVSFWAGARRVPAFIPVPMTEVLVPRTDIAPGTVLTPAMFDARFEPLSNLSRQVVFSRDELEGQVAAHLIVAGYALDRRYLRTDPDALPPGYRFVGILLDEDSEGANSVKPGDSIQLVGAIRDSSGTLRAAPLARKARVVRTQSVQGSSQRVAFVSVPEEEAARIDLVKREGTVLVMSS